MPLPHRDGTWRGGFSTPVGVTHRPPGSGSPRISAMAGQGRPGAVVPAAAAAPPPPAGLGGAGRGPTRTL